MQAMIAVPVALADRVCILAVTVAVVLRISQLAAVEEALLAFQMVVRASLLDQAVKADTMELTPQPVRPPGAGAGVANITVMPAMALTGNAS